MGEVAEMFDVNASLIRFWEQKFDVLKPDKNKKGNRLFTPADVENLKLIYHLVKENGMTLAGAQKKLKENRDGVTKNLDVIEKLQEIRALLLEVRQELKTGTDQMVEILVSNEEFAGEPLHEEDTSLYLETVAQVVSLPESVTPPEPIAPPGPVAPSEPIAPPEQTKLRIVEQTLF